MSGRIVVGTIQSINRCDSNYGFFKRDRRRVSQNSRLGRVRSYRTLRCSKHTKAKLIGLSATPYRMLTLPPWRNTQNTRRKSIHFNISVEELVDRGFLIMPDFKRGITKIEISRVGINGDFRLLDQVQSVYLERINEIVDECAQIIPKRNRALIFCV